MSLGLRVKQIREERNIDQALLAQRAGMSTATLAEIEAGLRHVSSAEIESLCVALGIRVDVLFTERQPPSQDESVLIPVDHLTALLEEMKKG